MLARIILWLTANVLVLNTIHAQTNGVAINGNNTPPHPSAMLDVQASNQGVLFPRMTQAQRQNIAGPATGLLVYQTDGTAGFYYFDGTNWVALQGGGGGGTTSTSPYRILSFPIMVSDGSFTSSSFVYTEYYGNFTIPASIYAELLAGGATQVQIKLVAIGYISGASTCNVRVVEYFSGNTFGSWTGTYGTGTDNINIETPWTTISSVPGHRGFRFEINNTNSRTFTIYNAMFYVRAI